MVPGTQERDLPEFATPSPNRSVATTATDRALEGSHPHTAHLQTLEDVERVIISAPDLFAPGHLTLGDNFSETFLRIGCFHRDSSVNHPG